MKHGQSSKHRKISHTLQYQRTISSMPEVSKIVNFERKVKEGELRVAAFLSEHNLSFHLVDHLQNLIKEVCKDSETAKSLKLGRTKATGLVKNVLGKEQFEKVCRDLQTSKFSLITLGNKKKFFLCGINFCSEFGCNSSNNYSGCSFFV
jgi:hypothetical protein